MASSSQTNKIIYIDYELVWDIWSLAFCCLRMEHPKLTNADYFKVFYKKPASFLSESAYAHFISHKQSVKPWHPYYSLYKHLEKLDHKVYLVDTAGCFEDLFQVDAPKDNQRDLHITANECIQGDGVIHV